MRGLVSIDAGLGRDRTPHDGAGGRHHTMLYELQWVTDLAASMFFTAFRLSLTGETNSCRRPCTSASEPPRGDLGFEKAIS